MDFEDIDVSYDMYFLKDRTTDYLISSELLGQQLLIEKLFTEQLTKEAI